MTLFDFNDGNGPVKAYRHRNPDGSLGGLVATTAYVEPTATVERYARVCGKASVTGNSRIIERGIVSENARIEGNATVSKYASVTGNAVISDNAVITDFASVGGNVQVFGNARVFNNSNIDGYEKISKDVTKDYSSKVTPLYNVNNYIISDKILELIIKEMSNAGWNLTVSNGQIVIG